MLRQVVTAMCLASSVIFSQAPEFAKQYEQRLGGAIDELAPIISNFDDDAARSDLSREDALEIYGRSHEQFLRDRGKSMSEVFARYDRLVEQQQLLEQAGQLWEPALILYAADWKLMTETRRDYSAALPLNLAGAVYAILGIAFILLFAAIARMLGHLLEMRRRATDL